MLSVLILLVVVTVSDQLTVMGLGVLLMRTCHNMYIVTVMGMAPVYSRESEGPKYLSNQGLFKEGSWQLIRSYGV